MVSKDKHLKRPQAAPVGRPPKDLAGDVKARILDAAQKVFLERGYQSASVDEIAQVAPASKPTIYAHFPGKEALFEAVVARVIDGLTNFAGFEPKGGTAPGTEPGLGARRSSRVWGAGSWNASSRRRSASHAPQLRRPTDSRP